MKFHYSGVQILKVAGRLCGVIFLAGFLPSSVFAGLDFSQAVFRTGTITNGVFSGTTTSQNQNVQGQMVFVTADQIFPKKLFVDSLSDLGITNDCGSGEYFVGNIINIPLPVDMTGLCTGVTEKLFYTLVTDFDGTTHFVKDIFIFKNSGTYDNTDWSAGLHLITEQKLISSVTIFPVPELLVCDVFDIGCYIRSAFAWLFVPDFAIIMKYGDYSLLNRFPWSLAMDMELLRQKFTTSMAISTMTVTVPFASFGTITLLSPGMVASLPLVNTMKLLLSFFIYFFLGNHVYRKIITSFDDRTDI